MIRSATKVMALLAVPHMAAAALKVGDAAPAAKAKNQDGKVVDIGAYYGHRPVVVFFFPKSFTGG